MDRISAEMVIRRVPASADGGVRDRILRIMHRLAKRTRKSATSSVVSVFQNR